MNQVSGDEDDEGDGVTPLEIVSFVLAGARRHRLLGIVCALVVGVSGTFIVRVLPPHFESNARIAVPVNMVAATALGYQQTVDVMKGVEDVVFRDDNLVAIVNELKLVDEWDIRRPPLFQLKDRAWSAIFGPLAREDKVQMMILMVRQSISVTPSESAITFRAEWRDPKIARELCRIVERNFLKRRSTEELSAIMTAMTVLESEMKRAADEIDPALAEVRSSRTSAIAALRGGAPVEATQSASATAAGPAPLLFRRPLPAPGDGGKAVGAKLEEVRRAEAAVRDPWQRRLAELRFQLADLKATYGPEHPAVLQQEAKIQTATAEPADLARLVEEEHSLLANLQAVHSAESSVTVTRVGLARAGTPAPTAVPLNEAAEAREEARIANDPEVIAADGRLASAIKKYNDMGAQLESARLQLATAQAAFNYKYVTVSEPDLPSKAFKPKRGVLFAAVWGAALGLGLIVGAIRDLLRRRALVGWQVRRLGVPVLAQIDLKGRITP